MDFVIKDSVTFRPREVSRVHFRINREVIDGQNVYLLADLGSSCGTYLTGTLLESQDAGSSATDVGVSKPLADLDVISLGPGIVNLFLFLNSFLQVASLVSVATVRLQNF